jgi:hypothetical protein
LPLQPQPQSAEDAIAYYGTVSGVARGGRIWRCSPWGGGYDPAVGAPAYVAPQQVSRRRLRAEVGKMPRRRRPRTCEGRRGSGKAFRAAREIGAGLRQGRRGLRVLHHYDVIGLAIVIFLMAWTFMTRLPAATQRDPGPI